MTPEEIVRTAQAIRADALARLCLDDGVNYSDPYWQGRADALGELLQAIRGAGE